MTVSTTLRNGDLTALTQLLADQRAHQIDVVAPSSKLSSREGLIRIDSDDMYMGTIGFTPIRGTYRPTDLFIGGLTHRLNLPVGYLRRLHDEGRFDIFDFIVNRTLHGQTRNGETIHAGDERSHMFRGFWTEEPDLPGLARSMHSPSYKIIDNYDVVVALVDALDESGIHTEVRYADVTERRMVVKFWAPELSQIAEQFVDNYRSTSGNGDPGSNLISMGARFANSETGDGRFVLVPEAVVRVCMNGQTIVEEMIAKTHLGRALDDGPVIWSGETQEANIALVRSQVKDVVKAWFNPQYLTKTVTRLERNAGIEVTNATETVQAVAKKFAYSERDATAILEHYLRGGQNTAGGVAQAVTAYSQTVADGDLAHDLDMTAVAAMDYAAALATARN